MDLDYFKKIRILDGGMGQELLARGLVSKGTLWSASALLDNKFHKLFNYEVFSERKICQHY